MSALQQTLFEPTGAELAPLALGHLRAAEQAKKNAHICDVRGWPQLSLHYAAEAGKHCFEAEVLAMLAEFQRLGGVS